MSEDPKNPQKPNSTKKKNIEASSFEFSDPDYHKLIKKFHEAAQSAKKTRDDYANSYPTTEELDRELDRISENIEKYAEDKGIFHDKLFEKVPKRLNQPGEKIIAGEANACIVLGRDRPGGFSSGYGARGYTQAGMVDMCVGLGARGKLPPSYKESGGHVYANPNFKNDAARMCLSEQSNVDENFGICKGRGAPSYPNRSTWAVKADQVRIIGDEGIKLVTRVSDTNSVSNARIKHVPGIDLIAGNNRAGLQPLVKGDNLVVCLEKLADHLDALSGTVLSHISYTLSYHSAIAYHKHDVPVSPQPSGAKPYTAIMAIPEFTLMNIDFKLLMKTLQKTYASLYSTKINVALFKLNYLKPFGARYILSRWNHTN